MNTQAVLSWRNQVQSPLLRLPRAVRMRIYEYAIGGLEIYVNLPLMGAKRRVISRTIGAEEWESPRQILASTESCRQIHAETKLMPFTANEFGGPLKALKLVISGCLFGSARVLNLANIRIHLTQEDVKYDGQEFRLKGPTVNLLQVLCGLPGLKQITVEWTKEAQDHIWLATKRAMLENMTEVFAQRLRTDNIQIEVVPSQR